MNSCLLFISMAPYVRELTIALTYVAQFCCGRKQIQLDTVGCSCSRKTENRKWELKNKLYINSPSSGTPAARPFQKSLFEFYQCSYWSNVTEVKSKVNKLKKKKKNNWHREIFANPFKLSVIAVFRGNTELLRTRWLGTFYTKQISVLQIAFGVMRCLCTHLFWFSLGNEGFFFLVKISQSLTSPQAPRVIKFCSVPNAQEHSRKKRHCQSRFACYSLLREAGRHF